MNQKKKLSLPQKILVLLFVLVLANVLSYQFFERFDLTIDNRYTLSPAAEEILEKAEQPILIEVFLEGEFPSEFKKLQTETRYLLEELASENENIKFSFRDPLSEGGDVNAVAQSFLEEGMQPARINVVENGRTSESVAFPWAVAHYKGKSVKIPLLRNQLGSTREDRVESSVQQLEYSFADALSKLVEPRKKKIAIMRGNGELPDADLADFLRSLQEYYFLAPFTLDSVATNPLKTLDQLREYDLIIEAKPTEAFSEAEKFVLDQYLMSGGKQLWLIDQVQMETDSLFSSAGNALALPRDLNLGDYFFKYGLRINPLLVKDLYSAPIILVSGRGNDTQFNPYPWFYYPLSTSPNDHPINNNLEAVKFEYASPMDILENEVDKTILLSSSPTTDLEGLPREISLEQISKEPVLADYDAGEQPLAVLLEGEFSSVYENRIKPFEIDQPLDASEATLMVVVSDGDVIKNELQGGQPMELGFDRYTGVTYGNKEFLLNTVNYLLDDSGLIELRSKEVSIAFLDLNEVVEEKLFWQAINLVLPLLLLGLFGGIFIWIRRKKYIK